MNEDSKFIIFKLTLGVLYEYKDSICALTLYGIGDSKEVELPDGATHYGVVVEGTINIVNKDRNWTLTKGDYFSIVGKTQVTGSGRGLAQTFWNYRGVNLMGGPIEEVGRLKYIDGCTDSLLIPPVKMGDPCLNHLHFPVNINQTPHTHPSLRAGIIYKGSGECVLPDKRIPLSTNDVWFIAPNTIHSFDTKENVMDVIAFHPDSDYGPQDENHPMINRTIVEGVSANQRDDIRTK